ncbi:MAG: hypothetical protein UW70_C0049G0019 [Candidatus Peregrinibacteria bacterium GW2011_GWA2_44_7]|nr:MAG: hypothetical protein UW70_C0049G0019 [Candidatus Peregrinibacteria bacterium GW2011_GWA2_44_7]
MKRAGESGACIARMNLHTNSLLTETRQTCLDLAEKFVLTLLAGVMIDDTNRTLG